MQNILVSCTCTRVLKMSRAEHAPRSSCKERKAIWFCRKELVAGVPGFVGTRRHESYHVTQIEMRSTDHLPQSQQLACASFQRNYIQQHHVPWILPAREEISDTNVGRC